MNKKKITIVDIIIVILLSLIVLVGIARTILNPSTNSKVLVIQTGRNKFYRYSLGQHKIIEVQGEIGKVIVEIDSNRFRFYDSSCPNKLCVHQGWVSLPNLAIVCLPNKVSAYIESKKPKKGKFDYDGISR